MMKKEGTGYWLMNWNSKVRHTMQNFWKECQIRIIHWCQSTENASFSRSFLTPIQALTGKSYRITSTFLRSSWMKETSMRGLRRYWNGHCIAQKPSIIGINSANKTLNQRFLSTLCKYGFLYLKITIYNQT